VSSLHHNVLIDCQLQSSTNNNNNNNDNTVIYIIIISKLMAPAYSRVLCPIREIVQRVVLWMSRSGGLRREMGQSSCQGGCQGVIEGKWEGGGIDESAAKFLKRRHFRLSGKLKGDR